MQILQINFNDVAPLQLTVGGILSTAHQLIILAWRRCHLQDNTLFTPVKFVAFALKAQWMAFT